MNEINLPKVEVKADITKTIENAYEDTLKQPLTSSSDVVSTVLDFFHNSVLYPMQKYNLYAKNKLEQYSLELQKKAQSIPQDNLISPRVNILGPTIEGLKYNLDEEYIKEMFENILVADMDNRKQNRVLPAYVEIIKQLSNSDAVLLKQIYNLKKSNIACIKITFKKEGTSFEYVSNDLMVPLNNSFSVLKPFNVDNLVRLNLINVTFGEYFTDRSIYSKLFDKVQASSYLANITVPQDSHGFGFTRGLLKMTDFGKNFIDICLS